MSLEVQAALTQLPPFESAALASLWSKDLSGLIRSLSYGQINNYLVELRYKTDDDQQRKCFKSMKPEDTRPSPADG